MLSTLEADKVIIGEAGLGVKGVVTDTESGAVLKWMGQGLVSI